MRYPNINMHNVKNSKVYTFKSPTSNTSIFKIPSFITPILFWNELSKLQLVQISDFGNEPHFRANFLLGEPPSRGLLYDYYYGPGSGAAAASHASALLPPHDSVGETLFAELRKPSGDIYQKAINASPAATLLPLSDVYQTLLSRTPTAAVGCSEWWAPQIGHFWIWGILWKCRKNILMFSWSF